MLSKLPKSQRLKKSIRITAVLRGGIRRQGTFFRILALQKQNLLSQPSVAIVVGKNQHKLATARNRMKRRTAAAARACLRESLKGYEVVIFPSSHVLRATFRDLCNEITGHVLRIKNYSRAY